MRSRNFGILACLVIPLLLSRWCNADTISGLDQLFPQAAQPPVLDRRVTLPDIDGHRLDITSFRFSPKPGQSEYSNTNFCGVVLHNDLGPDQAIIVIGIGDTETVSCDHLADVGPMPSVRGEPRVGFVYKTHSPNSPSIDAAIIVLNPATKKWQLDAKATDIVENLNTNLTLPSMRVALKNAL